MVINDMTDIRKQYRVLLDVWYDFAIKPNRFIVILTSTHRYFHIDMCFPHIKGFNWLTHVE